MQSANQAECLSGCKFVRLREPATPGTPPRVNQFVFNPRAIGKSLIEQIVLFLYRRTSRYSQWRHSQGLKHQQKQVNMLIPNFEWKPRENGHDLGVPLEVRPPPMVRRTRRLLGSRQVYQINRLQSRKLRLRHKVIGAYGTYLGSRCSGASASVETLNLLAASRSIPEFRGPVLVINRRFFFYLCAALFCVISIEPLGINNCSSDTMPRDLFLIPTGWPDRIDLLATDKSSHPMGKFSFKSHPGLASALEGTFEEVM